MYSPSRYVAIATQPVHRLQIRPIVHIEGASPTTPPSYIGVPAIVWTCGRGQTNRQTHRRAWPQYISRRLRLTRNVTSSLSYFVLVDPWFRHHLKSDRARRHCDSRGRSEHWIVHEFAVGIKQRTTVVTSSRSRSRSVCQRTRRKEEPDESRKLND